MTRKITALILSAILIVCTLPISANAATATRLKGDINSDGMVTVDDARLIMRACVGLDAAPKAGTDEFRVMKLTASLENEITMEDARMALRAALYLGDYTNAYTKAEITELLNGLANRIKTADFTLKTKMSCVSAVTTAAELTEYNFGEMDGLIKKMLDDDTDFTSAPETTYENSYKGKTVSRNTFPAEGSNSVLNLLPSDIKNIKISFNETANVYSGLPASINGKDYSSLIKTSCKGLIRIHVDMVTEKYSEVKNLAEGSTTPLMRFSGYDTMKAASAFALYEQSQDEMFTYTIISDCEEITTDASADFYFLPGTLTPVAVVYRTNQTVNVNIRFILSAEGETVVDGTMKQKCTDNKLSVFSFDSHYKNN